MASELVFAQTQGRAGFPPSDAAIKGRFLRIGNFCVDLRRQELSREGVRVRLTGKVYQALVALLEQPGEVVTREALRQRLWPDGTHVNYDANVNTTVNRLRQALGDTPEAPRYIETIPRLGYSFISKVEELDGSSLVPAERTEYRALGETRAAGSDIPAREWVLSNGRIPGWVKAGAVALVLAGMLIGAAIVLYMQRGV